ncbi:hypothetical protein FGO68_gene11787 [Halteria grandinella]|uniref:GP-PDE domain-containing protein n=1 Tax=Halteria grandinella TaxID=5974 RepID=A0A8J8SZU1_HALGN|nr:hypothetical protein FGO68_gene11787 [Halteria grandinella]
MLLYFLAGWLVFAHTVLLNLFICCKSKKKRLNLARLGIDTQKWKGVWPIQSAHRGGSKERTENTLSAFRHAMSLGVNLLECDVHMTKDGVVIVAHDSDLLRICGVVGSITDYNYADLPPIAKEFSLHFWFDTYKMRPEEDGKFTTLRELFEAAPDRLISIDLKGSSEGLSSKVDSLIREFNREDITIWGSMKYSLHKTLPTLNNNTPRFFSGFECFLIYTLYYMGLVWLYPMKSDVFMVPIATTSKMQFFGKMGQERKSSCLVRCIFIILIAMLRNCKPLFRHLRARGVPVVVWVLNEESDFEEALELFGEEIDGMMTDCPTKLALFAKSKRSLTV